jgi:hypothetical protein
MFAFAGTYSGEAWGRFGVVIRRAEDPKRFWQMVILNYLIGFYFLAYHLYTIFRP